MTLDDSYLLKMVSANIPYGVISKKLNIPVETIPARIAAIQKEMEQKQSSGYLELTNQYSILCNQFQLLGESLKIIAGALGNEMSDKELLGLIVPRDLPTTLHNLRHHAIILRPFTPISPQESLEKAVQGN